MSEQTEDRDTCTGTSAAGVDLATVELEPAQIQKAPIAFKTGMTKFNPTTKLSAPMRKVVALLFLIAIALIPFFIVVVFSREGGIWVLGYVTGLVTVPVVGFAVIGAMNTLSDERAFIGTIVFGFFVILISLTTGFWAVTR